MFNGAFGVMDIILVVGLVVGVIAVALYFLNRWAGKRLTEQQSIIDRAKQTVSIYVIDKKKLKAAQANFPKVVMDSLPRMYKYMKLPIVKAKIGPQIMTLLCDKKVFESIPVKRSVKVDLAGIYIVGVKGAKAGKGKNKPDEPAAKREKPWYLFWKK